MNLVISSDIVCCILAGLHPEANLGYKPMVDTVLIIAPTSRFMSQE